MVERNKKSDNKKIGREFEIYDLQMTYLKMYPKINGIRQIPK